MEQQLDKQNSQDTAGNFLSFFKKALSVLSVRGLIVIMSFLSSIALARVLGPEEKGLFSVALTFAAVFVQFGNLGLFTSNTYYLAKDSTVLPKVMGNSIVISAALMGLCVAVFAFFSIFPDRAPVGLPLLALALGVAPIHLCALLQSQMLLALDHIKFYNILDALAYSYPLVVLLLSLFIHVNSIITYCVFALTISCLALFGFVYLRRRHACKVEFSVPFMKKCLMLGIKAFAASFLCYLVLRVDILMVQAFLGNTEAGIYSIAASLVDILNIVSSTIGLLLYPETIKTKDYAQRRRLFSSVIQKVFWAMLAILIAVYFLSDFLIGTFYGQAYIRAVPLFQILLPGMLFWAMSGLFATYFAAYKIYSFSIIAASCALAVNLVLNSVLIPVWGISGAAIASTISYTLAFVIQLIAYFIKGRHGLVDELRLG